MAKNLIFNGDDFGASTGVNRGIIDCHEHGVLTSTSLMVTGKAVAEAVALSRDYPKLAIGLHWDVWGEDEREFDTGNVAAVQQVTEDDEELFLISAGGQVVRTDVQTINRQKAQARGVITMRLNEGDRVVAIAAFRAGLAERDGMGDDGGPDAGNGGPATGGGEQP